MIKVKQEALKKSFTRLNNFLLIFNVIHLFNHFWLMQFNQNSPTCLRLNTAFGTGRRQIETLINKS